MDKLEIFQSSVIPNKKNISNFKDQNEEKINVYKSENIKKNDNSFFLNDKEYNLINQIEKDKISVSESIESLSVKEFIGKYNWNILINDSKKSEEYFTDNVLLYFESDEIFSFKKKIDKLNFSLNEDDNEKNFNTIDQINSFETDNKKTSEQLIWRKIKGDGNCFFRVVIFSFLEKIILNKNINLLKNFVVDFRIKLREQFLISMAEEYNIDLKKAFKCLIMIYFSLTSKSHDPISKTYSVLIKLYNNFEDFDNGLIAYFRILLYTFIEENKGKTLSEEIQIIIDNLLPNEYKENNEYNFQSFYENYLFKFYQNDEKIVVYLTPFIFNFNIEIWYIDDISNINSNCKKLFLSCGDVNSIDNTIILLYKKTHYDLIYSNNYFMKYNKYLTIDYLAVKNAIHCIICKSQNKNQIIKFKKKDKEIIICGKCIIKEIKFNLKNLFIFFIQKQKRYFLSKTTESINNFLECQITLGNQIEMTVKLAIEKVKKIFENINFENLIKNVKSSICIMCNKPIEYKSKFKIILPCECYICSNICLNDYYKFLTTTMIFKEKIICLCGKIYSSNDVFRLMNNFNFYQINGEELLNFYIKKNQDKCYICLKKMENLMKCEIIDNNLSINSIMEHIICNYCYKKIEPKKNIDSEFKCQFCNSQHKFNKIIEKEININKYNKKLVIDMQ